MNSSKLATIFVILLTFMMVIWYAMISDHDPDPKMPMAEKIEFEQDTKPEIPTRILFKAARYRKQITPDLKNDVPLLNVCFESAHQLNRQSLEETIDQLAALKNAENFFKPQCRKALTALPYFQELLKQSECPLFSRKLSAKDIQGPCATMLSALKAHYIQLMSADTPVEDLTDQEITAHVVNLFFTMNSLDKKLFMDQQKVLDEFYERFPKDPAVLEAYIGYQMIGQAITKQKVVEDKINQKLDRASGQSLKMDRLKVIKNFADQDLKNADKNLRALKTQYPKEAHVEYLQAAYFWKQGQKQKALGALNKAIADSDQCSFCKPELYKKTKEQLLKANAGQKVFYMGIGLNFDQL